MSLSLVLTLVTLALTVFGNIAGWVWFIAKLSQKVAELQAAVTEHAAVISALPKNYVPREEVTALVSGIGGKIDDLGKSMNEKFALLLGLGGVKHHTS